MPVQVWSSGQTLTAAELTSVTNLLPYPATAGGNVNPCVAGTYYFCTATVTMTMPTPAAGTTIGFRCTAGGGVTINNHSSENFYSPYLASGSATAFSLTGIGQYVVFISDGTNWYEIASGGLAGKGMLATVETTGGPGITSTSGPGVQITGATATLTVVAGRTLRIRWTGYLTGSATTNGVIALTKGGSEIGQSVRQNYVVASQFATVDTEYLDSPAAGSVTYACNAWTSTGTLTPGLGVFTVEDVT